jgi:hypothetical protein
MKRVFIYALAVFSFLTFIPLVLLTAYVKVQNNRLEHLCAEVEHTRQLQDSPFLITLRKGAGNAYYSFWVPLFWGPRCDTQFDEQGKVLETKLWWD